jgi:hypothetical protein
MLVYYANGHFCSDLTQEEANPEEVAADQPFLLGVHDQSLADGSEYSDSPRTEIDLDDEVDLLDFKVGSEDGSIEEEGKSLVDSEASSLVRLTASGMSNTIPADLFTILVKTNHPSKRNHLRSDGPSSNKKRRLAYESPRILSSKAYHHRPLMTKRRAPINVDGNSSDEDFGRPHVSVILQLFHLGGLPLSSIED